jgi:hypothetical protein
MKIEISIDHAKQTIKEIFRIDVIEYGLPIEDTEHYARIIAEINKKRHASMCMTKGGILCLWNTGDFESGIIPIKILGEQLLKKMNRHIKPCPFDIKLVEDAKKQES